MVSILTLLAITRDLVCISEPFQVLDHCPALSLLFILDIEIGCRRADREECHASGCDASVQPRPWNSQHVVSSKGLGRAYLYCGASWLLNVKEPMIPPMPPAPTMVAEQKARRHTPRILLAWYVRLRGMLEFAPPMMRKAPKYRTPLCFAYPRTTTPMTSMTQLKRRNGVRRPILSEMTLSIRPRIDAKT
jgi:hypothetical protein